ncbi:MAG TPA: hypothetical protein VLE43_14525 [Candidatus Saccharimonadia bacterium]|nr:hypothetical protein [Candidatus Saccharimonadia bacterium]
MSENLQNESQANAQFCELCGKPGAAPFGGRLICSACYEVSGSCCAEFLEVDEDAERIKRIAREVAKGEKVRQAGTL